MRWSREIRPVAERLGARVYALRESDGDAREIFRRCTLLLLQSLAFELARRGGRHPGDLPRASEDDLLLAEVRESLCHLPDPDCPAHVVLSGCYEELLRYEPRLDAAAGAFCLARCREGRRSTGSFFTPAPVARRVVDAALLALEGRDPTALRVLDPAMGTGVFLVEAARALAERTGLPPAGVAERAVFGVDRDPLVVEVARLSLWLETGARPAVLARHLRRGDLLREPSGLATFDIVVGNPPWGSRCDSAEQAALTRRFSLTPSAFDSFKPFLALAAERTRGTVGMVVPQAMLLQESHQDVRGLLLRRLHPYAAINLGDGVFVGASAPACALVFGPKPGPRAVRCSDLFGVPRRQTTVPAGRWSPAGFPLAGSDALSLLDRLREQHPPLGRIGHLYRVRDVGINYNRAGVARRVLYEGAIPEDERDIGRYRGRDFDRYAPVRRGGWLRHDVLRLLQPGERFSLGWATCALPEKIVFRQTADRIVATLDTSRLAMGRSVIAITPEAAVSLLALLACLNSRLLTVLYRALAGETGRVLPQVKVSRMEALPVAAAALAQDGDGWWRLHESAGRLLALDGRDEDLQRTIDHLVYEAYGLSSREIALIEAG